MLKKIVGTFLLLSTIQLAKADIIVREDAALLDSIGFASAISGDGGRVIIRKNDPRSVNIFKLDQGRWVQEAEFLTVDYTRSLQLNRDGTRALVASRKFTNDKHVGSSAYLLKLENEEWIVDKNLIPDDPVPRDEFVPCASMNEDGTLVLFGLQDVAYAFRLNSGVWSQEAKFNGKENANFGCPLAMAEDGSRVFIRETSSVYVFNNTNGVWSQEAVLTSSNPSTSEFGVSLSSSADGRRAVVGSNSPDQSVFVFEHTEKGWLEKAGIDNPVVDGTSACFSCSLSLSADGNVALIGAPGESVNGVTDSGAVYLFKFNGESWVEEVKLVPESSAESDEFGLGAYLAADGSRALINVRNSVDNSRNRAIIWEIFIPPTSSPTSSPSFAPSLSPSTSPTSSPTSSPSFSPSTSSPSKSPVSELSDSDSLETGLEGSLHASEACSLDAQCLSGACSSTRSDDSFICASDPARPIIILFACLLFFILVGIIACFCCDVQRSKHRKKASKARAEALKAKTSSTQGALTVDQSLSNEAQRQVNDILLTAIEARRLVTSWPSDLTTLEIQGQVMEMVWRYELEAYTLMIALYDNKATTRLKNFNMTTVSTMLKACGTALITVCDQRINAEQSITSVLQNLDIAAAELTLPPNCSEHSTWGSLFLAGYKDPSWGLDSKNFRSMRATAISLKPAFASETTPDKTKGETQTKKDTSACTRMLLRIRTHKVFYLSFFLLETIVLLSWLGRINTDDEKNFSGPPGGFGNTFLPVPPQYNFAKSSVQPVTIPIVFGFMHCALVCLALLPLTFCRGFWRDITSHAPRVSDYVPVDDFEFVHRALGFSLLGLLLLGALLWLITMGSDCLGGVEDSCLAFDPKVAVFVNPIENVVMLRVLVLLTWFPLLPLVYWARSKPPSCLPDRSFLRLYWYEVCLYTHISVAIFTVLLALIARFKVFFPVLLPWLLYFADSFRESVLRKRKMILVERKVYSRAEDGIPTSMHLKFKVSKKEFPTTAGQWMYLQVPSIDRTWHPFSILNASSAEEMELLVGICASSSKDWHRGSRKRGFLWHLHNPTWTYKLYQVVTNTKRSISVNVRGPYGSKFSHCFDPTFGGSVLIGAGSGLTAALSILRETVSRRIQGIQTPSKVWFVWSCRKADDLMWCWELMTELVYEAARAGLFEMDIPTETSTMFDWLGVAIYVTQSSPGLVEQFSALHQASQSMKWLSLPSAPTAEQVTPDPNTSISKIDQDELAIEVDVSAEVVPPQADSRKEAIHKWLVSRVVDGSMDSAGSHITSLLKGVRDVLEVSEDPETSIAVAYCGPTALAFEIQEAVRHLGPNSKVQFSADHQ